MKLTPAAAALAAARPQIETIQFDADNKPTTPRGETWRPVPIDTLIDTDRYRVTADWYASNLGRIARVDHQTGDTTYPVGSVSPDTGYRRIVIGYRHRSNPRRTCPGQIYVHRLVAAAWHGAPQPGQGVARHLNGNALDNRPANVAWGSAADNYADSVRLGEVAPRHPCGKFVRAPLTPEERAALVADIIAELPYAEIARRHQVSVGTVGYHRRRANVPCRRPPQPVATA